MAQQRYHNKLSQDRMHVNMCPECGKEPELHFGMFGGPCGLREDGVLNRIAQFKSDKEEGADYIHVPL